MSTGTRWLDEGEQQAWRATLEATIRLLDRLNDDLKSQSGLTLDDYEVLVFLSEQPERRLRMSDLAESIISSRSRLTYRVDRLEARGLVCRQACPEDGRVVYAVLTDAGLAALSAAAPGHVGSVRANLLDHFDRDEFVRLGEWMERLAAHLRE